MHEPLRDLLYLFMKKMNELAKCLLKTNAFCSYENVSVENIPAEMSCGF